MKKFSVNPVFVILAVWIIFANGINGAVAYFIAVLLHELAHYLMAKHRGYVVSKFSLSPYGAQLSYYGQALDGADELFVALAGPITNLVLAFCCVGFWWIFPALYTCTHQFFIINLGIALVNLLPAYPLDGGRAFVMFFSNLTKRKVAYKITIAVNILLSILFFILFFVFCFINFNPTFLLFAVFLVLGVCDMKFASEYEKISIFNKKVKNFSKPKFYAISGDAKLSEILGHIDANKTCFFVILKDDGQKIIVSDLSILRLALVSDVTKPISNFLMK